LWPQLAIGDDGGGLVVVGEEKVPPMSL